MSRVLGLDIGGSTTRARLVTDDVIVAEVSAASASVTAAGPAAAADALDDLLAQLPPMTASLDAVCAGAAGARTAPDTYDLLCAKLAPLTSSGQVVVVDDASLTLPAAGLTDGIAVVCGTGSIAVGSWRGASAWAGGWGYLLGDEGSGYWIVRSAIRTLLARRAQDLPGGPLQDCLLGAVGVADADQVLAEFYRLPQPSHWARLAPQVLDCGDPEVARLIEAAAAALCELAVLVARRLAVSDDIPLVLAGGVMAHQRLLAATTTALTSRFPASRVLRLSEPPVSGAVRLAAAAAARP